MLKVRNCGARCGVALSSSARYGIIRLGLAQRSLARFRKVGHGFILALRGTVGWL